MDFDSERGFLARPLLPHQLWDLWLPWLSCFVNSFVRDKRAATARGPRGFSPEPLVRLRLRCTDIAIEEHRELRGQKCGRKFCWYKIRYVIRLRNRVCPLPWQFSRCATYHQILTNVSRAMDSNAFVSHQWSTHKCIERNPQRIKDSHSPRYFIAFVAAFTATLLNFFH